MRDYVAAQCSKEKGAAGLAECCDKMFRALSEYCLQTDAKLTGTVTLTAKPEGVQFALNDAAPADLSALLPAEYTGAVDAIPFELSVLSPEYGALWPWGEAWCQELEVYHNPLATNPIPFDLIPGATHWFERGSDIECSTIWANSVL